MQLVLVRRLLYGVISVDDETVTFSISHHNDLGLYQTSGTYVSPTFSLPTSQMSRLRTARSLHEQGCHMLTNEVTTKFSLRRYRGTAFLM